VRVSLFLSEGIQGPNGRLILPSCLHNRAAAAAAASGAGGGGGDNGGGGGAGEAALGRVRVFDAGGALAWEGRRPLAVLQVVGGGHDEEGSASCPSCVRLASCRKPAPALAPLLRFHSLITPPH
jgi:hypothetical protein